MPKEGSSRARRGSGSIFEKHGAYYGKWRIGGRMVTRKIGPKRPEGTRDGLTKVQAQRRLNEMMADTGAGLAQMAERITLEEAGRRLLADMQLKGKKRSTRSAYESTLRVHLVPSLPAELGKITGEDVERYMLVKLNGGRAVKSVFNDVAVLNRVFTFARRKRWVLTPNPVEEVERPRDPYLTDEVRYFRPEEVAALVRSCADCSRHTPEVRERMCRLPALRAEGLSWKACAGRLGVSESTVHYYRAHDLDEQDPERVKLAALDAALIETAVYTGLRQGELIALRWRDVDFAGENLYVERSRSRGEFVRPKSGRSRRVPLLDNVARTLARHSQQSSYVGENDLVFAHPETGKPLDPSKLLKRFKATCIRAGLDERPFHDLRHTYATRLATLGVDLIELQGFMGHQDIKTTMRYARFMPSGDTKSRLQARFDAADHKMDHKLSETQPHHEAIDATETAGFAGAAPPH